MLYSKIGSQFSFVAFKAFSYSTEYVSYDVLTNGTYLITTTHHGSWTYNSLFIVFIIGSGKSVVKKLDSGENIDEYVNITVDDDNHRIVVTNNGAATLHCAIYQLLKVNRRE